MTQRDPREERAAIWEQMKALNAESEKHPLTAEETQTYDRMEAQLDALEADIVRAESHARREAEFNKVDRGDLKPGSNSGPPANNDAYKNAFVSWMKLGSADMPPDHRAALRSGFVGADIMNAAGVATGAAGGFTIPPEFRNEIIERQKQVSSVRNVSQEITTRSGANMPWPTVDDTANVGAILAENTAVTEQDVVFGTASIDAYMYTSKLVRVSLQLINDGGFSVETWLKKALGTRIARIQNQHFTTGTGTAQPDGIVTNAPVGKVGLVGQTTSIIYEDLVDLIDSLDPAYLDGNEQWMVSQGLRKSIRKIKDTQGHPLWEPSLQVGMPDSLLGYGMVLNNDMPVPAASAKCLLFGDFGEAYLVRDVNDIFLVRFAERYMDFLQVGFAMFQRTDGTVQNTYAYTAYQNSAT